MDLNQTGFASVRQTGKYKSINSIQKFNFPGSEKAWAFLSDDFTPYKLYIAVTVLPPVESIIHCQFRWQSDLSWLASNLADVPMVCMSNMTNSPACKAMNMLTMFLKYKQSELPVPDGESDISIWLECFAHMIPGKVPVPN